MGNITFLKPEDVAVAGGDHISKAKFNTVSNSVHLTYMLRRAGAHLHEERTAFLLRMNRLERNPIPGMPRFISSGNDGSPTAIFSLPDSFRRLNVLHAFEGSLAENEVHALMQFLCNTMAALEAVHAAPLYILPEDICVSQEMEYLLLPSALRNAGHETLPPSGTDAMFFAAPELLETPEKAGRAALVFSIARIAAFALQPQHLPGNHIGLSEWLKRLKHLTPVLPESLSEPFRRVLNQAMRTDTDNRYRHCGELLTALQSLSNFTIEAVPPPAEKQFTPQAEETSIHVTQNDTAATAIQIPADVPAISHDIPDSSGKYCINKQCGKSISISAAYCRFCGQYQLTDRNKQCPHCGNTIPFSSDYCQVCENIL